MSSHVAWDDIRAAHVERAGGEVAVDAGKRRMLAEVVGHPLAEIRRARGLTQQHVAVRMGVTKGRISRIERGKVSGRDVLARYAVALGGRCTRRSTSTTATSPPSPERGVRRPWCWPPARCGWHGGPRGGARS